MHQVATGQPTTLVRTEAQLAGTLGPNIADPAAQGAADAPAAEPSPVTAPIEFVISRVINLNQDTSERGNFVPDEQMPGIPGLQQGTDNIAAEVLTWLELPAGEIIMGVNSDDGFRVTIGGGSPKDPFATIVGLFDAGRGAGDTIFRFNITQAGLYAARLIYNEGASDASVEWFTQNTAGTKTLINDVANGGIKAYRAVTSGNAVATFTSVSPGINGTGVFPNAPINVQLTEGGTPIALNTISVTLDGNPAAVTPTKNGNVITINHVPTALYAPSSSHEVSIRYTEGTTQKTVTWRFTVAAYGTLTANLKVTPDTTKPGFLWNIFANAANTTTSNQRAEDALAGLLLDVDGNPLPNNADPSAQGVALAAAAAANPANAPLRFEIPGVINLAQDSTNPEENQNGNFVPDLQMPGIPATDGTEGIAAEAITYIDLPAGVIVMGVNSDDGFRTTGGNPLDVFQAVRLGEFDAGRGASDTLFSFVVQEAGVYAFRTLWEEGTGGANIEWFTLKADGSKVLVNDFANGGFRAYRAIQGGTPPYVKAVSPTHINRLVNQPSTNLVIILAPGSAGFDSATPITLKIDGVAVTPVTVVDTATGIRTLTYNPTTLQIPYDAHTAELSFKSASAGATTRVQQWTFRNLRNYILPNPLVTENFDAYEEGSVPTGWVETNFTTTVDAGFDLDNLESDTYKGWVVVGRERLQGLKGRIFNAAPGQTVNGVEVTADTISSGNLLYAESDVRDVEVQFITSDPFNLSTITNVVMSFASLYEQNQDSIGAVEYSVDGGNNWLPVIYYIDTADSGGDIKYKTDGTVDAIATLTGPNSDTAQWVTNGIPKGDKYGDALAAPITDALGVYIAPRVNDNSTVDKRIEVFSLPQAGKKADVRLRFAQLGTGSWYFGVDDIAFYEGPVPASSGESRLSVTSAGNQVTIAWTGNGTLETTATLPSGWEAAPSQANPQTVTAAGARFYRVRR
ncbi:MAG TPA: hypothetical protein VF773_19485 [Verrucomicrobiae bacterium]